MIGQARGRVGRTLLCALLVGVLPAVVLGQSAPATQTPPPTGSSNPVVGKALLAEPAILTRAVNLANRMAGDAQGRKSGFYPEMSNMPTGAGWISIGPGYRQWFGDGAVIDASASLSWRGYKMAQARFELTNLADNRVTAGVQGRWQDLTQISYFGNGPDTFEDIRSEYRLKSTNIVGYATFRPIDTVTIGGRYGWLGAIKLSGPGGYFERGNPAAQDVFPGEPAFLVPDQPNFDYGEVSTTFDNRDHRSHPTSGSVYRAAWSAYSDRDLRLFSFTRTELEGAHFIPFDESRFVLAMHGWLVASDSGDDQVIPLYLQASLGGHNTLRSYSQYRFHDRNALSFNVEGRVALLPHVDAALFFDAGNVGAKVGDLNLDRRSYGAGLRLHSDTTTFARMDVAHGDEGWAFMFRVNDPLHLARFSKRTAPAPFVP